MARLGHLDLVAPGLDPLPVDDVGDLIITSDPLDIARLAKAAGKQVAIAAI